MPRNQVGAGLTAGDPIGLTFLSPLALVQPGTEVILDGGTYSAADLSTWGSSGTIGNPIVVTSAPGERATIDLAGSDEWKINGGDVVLRDVRVTSSRTDRTNSTGRGGVHPIGARTHVIDCLLDNLGVAISSFSTDGAGSIIGGNVALNQGWQLDPYPADRGHGHCLYCANGTGVWKKILFNIFGQGYGWCIHCYSASQTMEYIEWQANIAGLAGMLSQGTGPVFPNIRQSSIIGGGGTVSHHKITDHFQLDSGFYLNYDGSGPLDNLVLAGVLRDVLGDASWTNVTDTSTRPTGDAVYVRSVPWERGRAIVAVYNDAAAASVTVDVSGVLEAGDSFGIFDAWADPDAGPVTSGTYTGSNPTVPMTGRTYAVPVGGWRWGPPPSVPVDRGAFVVRKNALPLGYAPQVADRIAA